MVIEGDLALEGAAGGFITCQVWSEGGLSVVWPKNLGGLPSRLCRPAPRVPGAWKVPPLGLAEESGW